MTDNPKSQAESERDALLWIPAIVLIALWGVIFVILLTPEIPDGVGFSHSTYHAMDQGGDGARRHRALLVSGWIFGSLQIAFFVSLLAWGMLRQPSQAETTGAHRTEKTALHLWLFLVGGLFYEGVFGMMCLAYRNSLTSPDVAFLGPFPAGVSWLLFGIWLFPAYFIVLYVMLFNRYVVSPQNMQRFEELVGRVCQVDDSHETG